MQGGATAPLTLNQPIQFYSCFISYSVKDQDMAERLHADLQNKGVRCWFAPHDLPIGAKILDGIDEAIRLRDKVLLILSEHSIKSDWVEDEVTTAFEEERKRGQPMLFPIRLDDIVMATQTCSPQGRRWRRPRSVSGRVCHSRCKHLHGRTFDRQEIDTRTVEAHSLKKPVQRSIPRWPA